MLGVRLPSTRPRFFSRPPSRRLDPPCCSGCAEDSGILALRSASLDSAPLLLSTAVPPARSALLLGLRGGLGHSRSSSSSRAPRWYPAVARGGL